MKKILLKGLALGNYANVCMACNVDIDWVVQNPSTFLLAEKIIVPSPIWSQIQNETVSQTEMARSIKLVFDIAKSEGVVEVFKPESLMSKRVAKKIFSKIEKKFPSDLPETNSEKLYDHANIQIGNHKYCQPQIWKIFASMYLARKMNANCFFQPHEIDFIESRKKSSFFSSANSDFSVMSKVFGLSIPEPFTFHHFAFQKHGEHSCKDCAHQDKCRKVYEKETEENFIKFLKLRNVDEVRLASEALTKVTEKAKSNSDISFDQLRKEFSSLQTRLQKRVNLVFPKIRRWSNIVTIGSIPIALSGLFLDVSALKLVGASLAGASQIAKETISYLDSKYRWLGYLNTKSKKHT